MLNVVEIYAHYVICILNPGKCETLAQEQTTQIIVLEQSNVPRGENSNELDLLSYKRHGNAEVLPQHGPKKRRLAAPKAASFCRHEWMEHLAKPGSQGGCSATPVDMLQTRHVPETDYTHAARWARVIEPRFRRRLARAPFRKAPPAWSFPCALWRLLVDPNTFRGKQRHGIGFVQHGTRTDVFDEVFRALVWQMSASRRTPRSWHVSQGFTLSKNNNRSGISGLRLVHTLDTAGKMYYSQLWKLVTQSWQRDYATGYCHRRRREQAIAQHGSTVYCGRDSEQQRRTSRQHSTTSPMPLHAVPKDHRPTILHLWLVWYEQRYKTLQHENTSVRDWQVRSCDSTVQMASWQQRSEVVHSQATQWQDVGSYYTFTRNWMCFLQATPELQINATFWMWAHQHTQMTSFERFQGPLQKMVLIGSITPTMLLTLLWHLIMFKTAANKRYSLISLVAGHTQSFDSFSVTYTIWRVACIAVFGIWDHNRLRETHTRSSNVSSRRPSHYVGAVLFFRQWWLVWLFLAWLLLPRHRLKRTKWTNVCWHSHAKLSKPQPRTLTDTYAQDHPNGYGNKSSWFQQMCLWQCSDCYGGNKLLVIPHARGRSCFPFLVAFLSWWTIMERSHPLHIPGYDYWCLICGDSTMYYSWTIWMTQWLIHQSFSLIRRSGKPFSMQISMCWWQSGRLNAYHLQVCQLTNGLMYVKRYYRTERRALRLLRQKIALAAHQTHSKKHARGVKRCVASALVCSNQCCNCGAILATRACLRIHLKHSVQRGFCRASHAKGSPTQTHVEFTPCRCSLCGEKLSEKGLAHAHMAAHLRTFLPDGDLVR